jgi:hypothetical protein
VYLQRVTGQNWDVFPDGKEFLMIRQPSSVATSGFVIVNWPHLRAATVNGGIEER